MFPIQFQPLKEVACKPHVHIYYFSTHDLSMKHLLQSLFLGFFWGGGGLPFKACQVW